MRRKSQLERQLQSERMSEDEKLAQRQALQQQERDYIRLQRQRLSSEDFEALKLIGRGAFGEVCQGWPPSPAYPTSLHCMP